MLARFGKRLEFLSIATWRLKPVVAPQSRSNTTTFSDPSGDPTVCRSSFSHNEEPHPESIPHANKIDPYPTIFFCKSFIGDFM